MRMKQRGLFVKGSRKKKERYSAWKALKPISISRILKLPTSSGFKYRRECSKKLDIVIEVPSSLYQNILLPSLGTNILWEHVIGNFIWGGTTKKLRNEFKVISSCSSSSRGWKLWLQFLSKELRCMVKLFGVHSLRSEIWCNGNKKEVNFFCGDNCLCFKSYWKICHIAYAFYAQRLHCKMWF